MSPEAQRATQRLTLIWILVMLALFPILAALGGLMRVGQSNMMAEFPADRFYSVMTLHGVGMVGVWFAAAMGGVTLLLTKYVRVRVWTNWVALIGTVIGVVLLLVATLIGKFGAGWYFLYPLPFKSAGVWEMWYTACFFGCIAILGVVWTLWCIDLLWGIASRYTLSAALSWHLIRGKQQPEVPPMILISTVSLIGALTGLVTAVVMLVLYGIESLVSGSANDALLMKNLVFLFGHLLVNVTLYLGVAMLYELMPIYVGRPWNNNKLVAIAWNVVLVLVVFAYFHHLYMDFVQLRWFQVIGQITSYASAIPASVMSIFGLLALVHKAQVKWSMTSMMLFLGVLGWAIGGIGAVIDSTIAVNTLFHNTLWVPAHFHTYFLMGVVMMILGAAFHVCESLSKVPENKNLTKVIVALMCLGGYGFLLMFYVAGVESIPRRYASYGGELSAGADYARIAVYFIGIFLVGLVLYIWETARRCVTALKIA